MSTVRRFKYVIYLMALTPSASEPRAQITHNLRQITMLHGWDDRQEMRTTLDIGRDRVHGFHQFALLTSAPCAQFCIGRVALRYLQREQTERELRLWSSGDECFALNHKAKDRERTEMKSIHTYV